MSSIRYVAPLDRALQHMRTMLFRPFAAKKWLVIAFAAWLADLGSGGGGGPSSTFDASDAVRKSWGAADAGLLPPGLSGPFSEWSSSSAFFGLSVLALGLVVIGAVLLALLVLWISARGKFIFLDCVIHDRAAIKAPWSRYRQQGNSLFLWNLAWITAGMLAVSAVAAAVMLGGLLSGLLSGFEPGVAPIIGLVLAAALPVIPLLYLFLWIESFVVPIMYRREIAILEALGASRALCPLRPLLSPDAALRVLRGDRIGGADLRSRGSAAHHSLRGGGGDAADQHHFARLLSGLAGADRSALWVERRAWSSAPVP